MPEFDLLAALREELICREFYGRMMQRLDSKMEAVARFLAVPELAECSPSLTAIEAMVIYIIERAEESHA